MITYSISFACMSRSERGYGKLAWRVWRMYRDFENGELPRLPSVGERVRLVLFLTVVCRDVHDSFGGRMGMRGEWDPAMPVTTLSFELHQPHKRLDDVGCYEPYDLSAEEFQVHLRRAGFDVRIEQPYHIQTPTETQPPTLF